MGCGIRPGGSSGRPTPTHHSPIELRRGRRPRRPALPWARCGLAMTHYKKCGTNPAGDRKGRPYGGLQAVQGAGRCGERTERCRWQRKRSERVAAVKILSVRRKAAQKFWAPQQDHRPLRRVTRGAGKESPSHGVAVPGPFRQGGRGTGVRIATASVRTGFAMTGGVVRGAVQGYKNR